MPPILFDDAFAYTDPNRIRSLHRMLDLATVRGLQVIILTCTPSVTLQQKSSVKNHDRIRGLATFDVCILCNFVSLTRPNRSPKKRLIFK